MEKIDTDYKQRNLKSLAKLFKPFNRDWAPLRAYDSQMSDRHMVYQLAISMMGHKIWRSVNKFCGEDSEWQGSPAYLELTEGIIQSLAIKTKTGKNMIAVFITWPWSNWCQKCHLHQKFMLLNTTVTRDHDIVVHVHVATIRQWERRLKVMFI